MEAAAKRKYNIIIFGATGFTGKYLIQETVNFLKDADKSELFTWAVAARSKDKLKKILEEISENTGEDLSNVDTIVADINNDTSLRKMAAQCDIVLNCVGPYILWGEAVVKACLAERTHHLDLSGEAPYLEKIQLLYNKEAAEKNVYIIAPCGFDSIPADLGTTYLKQNFGGDLNSVELYVKFNSGSEKPVINYGTFHSAIHFMSKLGELRKLNKELFPEPLPKPKHKLAQRFIHNNPLSQGWSLPNPFPDQRIVERSQRYFYHEEGERPIQIKGYLTIASLFYAFLMMIGSACMAIMCQFKFGRYLFQTYPEYLTLGSISKEGPSPAEMENLKFTFTLVGKGWNETLSEKTDQHATPPNKTKVLLVKGTNPGYKATNIIFLHSALIILKEKNKMPKKGGVYTPGVAFAKTSLVDRLNRFGHGEAGIKFM
jgi:short subunit dehydrogenase-like uncharacterized protein